MNTPVSTPNVVVTGLGLVTPIGIGVDAFLESLQARRSGIGRIDFVEGLALPEHVAGEVKEFTPSTAKKVYLKPVRKQLRVMCREIQLGVASAALALEHAGVDLGAIDHTRLGIEFGANLMLSPPDQLQDAARKCAAETSNAFEFDRWGDDGFPAMEPLWLLKYLPNMPACHIGLLADCQGPSNSITQDEASAGLVLGEASRIIERGWADLMVTGTTGTRAHAVKSMHARLWDQLAESDGPPETWCRPFDANRSGQVGAEGAATLMLEDETHATGRGATIHARLIGFGASCVADRAGQPDPRKALANAMTAAIADAGLTPADIGHVNAHGLASTEADVAEAAAIHDVFGDLGATVPVTALKSFLGNAGSGCGMQELAASILCLREGVVPPTLNYETPDDRCPLNVVHGEPLPTDNPHVLKVNVTRMGQASAVVARVER